MWNICKVLAQTNHNGRGLHAVLHSGARWHIRRRPKEQSILLWSIIVWLGGGGSLRGREEMPLVFICYCLSPCSLHREAVVVIVNRWEAGTQFSVVFFYLLTCFFNISFGCLRSNFMTQNHKLSLNSEREFNCCRIIEFKNANTWCLCLLLYKNGMSGVFLSLHSYAWPLMRPVLVWIRRGLFLSLYYAHGCLSSLIHWNDLSLCLYRSQKLLVPNYSWLLE